MKNIFRTSLLLLINLFVISCDISPDSLNPYTADLLHNPEIAGLWLECWAHDEEYQMYFPGSYGAAENPNYETTYFFKEDGTGYFLERFMNISDPTDPGAMYSEIINTMNTNDNLTYTVVTRNGDSWIENDELFKKRHLYWGITTDEKMIIYLEDYKGDINRIDHEYEYDPAIPRSSNFKRTIDRYPLGVEMKITWLSSMKKIGNGDAAEFLDRYGIE